MSLALLLCVGVLSPAAAEERALIAGSSEALWLVTGATDDGGRPLTSMHVRTGDQWTTLPSRTGVPQRICIHDKTLHLFYEGGGYWTHAPDGSATPGSWPAPWAGLTPRAVATNPNAEATELYALMRAPAETAADPEPATSQPAPAGNAAASTAPAETQPTATQPKDVSPTAKGYPTIQSRPAREGEPDHEPTASAPASAGTTTPADALTLRSPGGEVFVLRGNRWRRLAALPDWKLPSSAVYSMAVGPEGLYLLACVPDGAPVRFAVFQDDRWRTLPNPAWSERDGQARGLIAAGQDLLLAGTVHETTGARPWLRLVQRPSGELDAPRPIRQEDEPLVIGSDEKLAVGPMGATLAIAWGEGANWTIGTLRLNGDVTNVAEEDFTGPSVQDRLLLRWTDWLPVVLTALIVGVLIYRYRKGRLSAMRLPADRAPTPWIKRILAFLIDAVPLGELASLLSGAYAMDHGELTRLLEQISERQEMPPAMTRMLLLWMAMLLIYSILAEWKFGATLGKRLLRMEVVGPDGARPTIGPIFLRNITKPMELLTPLNLLFVLWPLFTKYRQRVGDILACTAVVDRKRRPVEPQIVHQLGPLDQRDTGDDDTRSVPDDTNEMP